MSRTSNSFVRSLVVSGSAGRDVIVKLRSVDELGRPFTKFVRKTLPYSKIPEFYGRNWTIDSTLRFLEEQALAPIYCSYGGRAPHVAYGIAKLGGDVRLVTVFGDDYDEPYRGFFGGGYWTHLKRAGVEMEMLTVSVPSEAWKDPRMLRRYLESCSPDIYQREALRVCGRVTSTIVCCRDLHGNDWFYIDDERGAGYIEVARPAPTGVLKETDLVFVTTSEPPFMREIVLESSKLGKEVLVDIGSYGITPEFLREVVPHSRIIFGNLPEVGQVCDAYGIEDVEEIFDATESRYPQAIVIEDKLQGAIHIITRKESYRVGPITLEKIGSSVGCCDGMAAGFLCFYQRGFGLRACARAGLVLCSSIWRVEGVQEGMLDPTEFYEQYERLFREECSESELSRIRQALKLE